VLTLRRPSARAARIIAEFNFAEQNDSNAIIRHTAVAYAAAIRETYRIPSLAAYTLYSPVCYSRRDLKKSKRFSRLLLRVFDNCANRPFDKIFLCE
jgi:hypothetical protein